MWIANNLRTDRHGAASRWLPTADPQHRGFAVLFEDDPENFSALVLVYSKKVTEISSKTVEKVTTVPKTIYFLKVSTVPITVLKTYRVAVPRYCPTLCIITLTHYADCKSIPIVAKDKKKGKLGKK